MHITLLAALLAISPSTPEETIVSVQLQGGSEIGAPAVSRARGLATQMFVTAGVRLQWCDSPQHCQNWEERLIVTIKERAPRERSVTARAAANLFQGRDIEIYLDRMPRVSHPNAPAYWAHVLVHEITHLLQACDYHAPQGVMKAHWTHQDVAAMQNTPLPFTNYDILLIRAGLAHRRLLPPAAPAER
jgi:hypothetical protein